MPDPLVSVIIPAYNCERFVEESVLSALGQTVSDLDIIVIDDASIDGTVRILERLATQDGRIRLLRNESNLGVAETRNRGFAEARGQYIAFLDSDDIWQPDKLRQQLHLMEEIGCDFCYTGYSFVDEAGQAVSKAYQVPEAVTLERMLGENVIGCSTVLCKAELLKQYRMWPQYAHEDYVLWLELLREGYTARGINQPLMKYRLQRGGRSRNKSKAAAGRWSIYRDFLGLSPMQAGRAFLQYTARGVKKYLFLR